MPTDLDQLITPETEDQALEYYLTELANVGFPVTAWQSGGVAYTIIRILAKKSVDFFALINAIARGGLLDLATGLWLTLLAAQIFRLTRYAATFAVGQVRVAIAAGNPGQTIQPGQLWFKLANGLRYNSVNPSAVVIAAGSSAVIPFKAEQKGTRYNVALGTGITFVTPLPGMTGTFEDTGNGTPWTVQGSDDESDEALRVRCRSKWTMLGTNKPRDAYVFLATNVPGLGTQPNRVAIDDQNPRGPNSIDIWLAGPSGPLPSADVALINTYLQARKSPCANLEVNAAQARPITIAATLLRAGEFSQAKNQAVENVTATLQQLPLGGTVRLSQVIEDVMTPDGAINCTGTTVNGTAADLTIGINEVATVAAVNILDVVQN